MGVQRKNDLASGFTILFVGCITLWLIISHIAHFEYPDYFYNVNPTITTYVGTNVVSPWADFSYFTHLTLILFGVYCVLFSLAKLLKIARLSDFLSRDDVACFIFCNYLLTVVLYTAFELSSPQPTFGLYAKTPGGIHSFGTNVVQHYVLFIPSCVLFFKQKTRKVANKKSVLLIVAYLSVYYAVVKITGEFAYNIRWFPYVIFDAQSIGSMVNIENRAVSIIILIAVNAVILAGYLLIYRLLIKYKSRFKTKEEEHKKSPTNL